MHQPDASIESIGAVDRALPGEDAALSDDGPPDAPGTTDATGGPSDAARYTDGDVPLGYDGGGIDDAPSDGSGGATHKIGRMTLNGEVTEFSPTAGSGPDGIVAGPDGNLWFTEMTGNRIGRITTTGSISEYSVPNGSSQPARIDVGSDGNLWFTMYGTNRIGYLAPTTPTPGPIGSYGISSLSSYTSAITGDLDGHLWFYESGTNKIGRMTTAGDMEEYDVPTANGYTSRASIALGPDNNIWFTEYSANQIGRVTHSGSITEFQIPTKGRAPFGIVKGPDGLIWFTEASGNKLASIVP